VRFWKIYIEHSEIIERTLTIITLLAAMAAGYNYFFTNSHLKSSIFLMENGIYHLAVSNTGNSDALITRGRLSYCIEWPEGNGEIATKEVKIPRGTILKPNEVKSFEVEDLQGGLPKNTKACSIAGDIKETCKIHIQ